MDASIRRNPGPFLSAANAVIVGACLISTTACGSDSDSSSQLESESTTASGSESAPNSSSSSDSVSESSLEISTVRGDASDLFANYTIISGNTEAMLIDMPFTRSGSERLVEEIRATEKSLSYIFVTHPHPDHYFGAKVVLEAFPEAKYYALPTVADAVERSILPRIEAWEDILGPEGPERDLPAPQPYTQPTVEIDGAEIQILGPLHGDVHDSTVFYAPSIEAVVGGDIVFGGIDLFFAHYGSASERLKWAESIDQIIALDPKIVVPGHSTPDTPNDLTPLLFTRDYLRAFEGAFNEAQTPDDIVSAMIEQFPDAVDLGGLCILNVSAVVAMGVIPPIADDAPNPDVMFECSR